MRHTIIDIETTGLEANSDLLSVAYLTIDSETLKKIESGIMYYYYPGQSPNKAEHINGIPDSFLKTQGDKFDYNVGKLAKIFVNSNMVSWNGDRFDIPRIQSYLAKHHFGETNVNSSLDLYKIFKKKLTVSCENLNITKHMIERKAKEFFPEDPLGADYAHNAGYDVAATYLHLLRYATKNGGLI